ncbi:hypothetical protein [Sediminibacillus terrae]|uniref:hypothetical protein n=1 Tax=Sediminibacillus terrae TaxID=1562106 RepID=UPI0012950820|nr:hypothetical protein [Sediminibacillus terrae]
MDFEVELFDWSQLWEVTGPFIIMGITAVVLCVIALIVISVIPKGIVKELVRVIAIVCVLGGSVLSLYIASQIWGA